MKSPSYPMISPSNKATIRSLFNFKMSERNDLSMQYSVPYKQTDWLFGSVKIMLNDFLKRDALMNHPNNLR